MTGDWFEQWVSLPRFERYLVAAGHDRRRARRLHERNARVAAAFLHDHSHLEVGLRNAYDRALRPAAVPGDTHWTQPRTLERLFPSSSPGRSSRNPAVLAQWQVQQARQRARRASGGEADPGAVVAELMFGFWTSLLSDRFETTVWRPFLHTAYAPGTHRPQVHGALDDLRRFRNRAAHHEYVLPGAEHVRRVLVGQVRRLSPDAALDLRARSRMLVVLQEDGG